MHEQPSSSVPMLTCRVLGKDYGAKTALEALDLDIAEGEVFGFLGPNGAGKTTAISLFCGALTPTRGSVAIRGHDLARDGHAARRCVGLVPQELGLYEDLNARQNLRYFGRLQGLRGEALEEAVAWALGVANLEDRSGEPIERYSGGMKRRLNLVIGLLHRPPLLICDEPTVGVDPQSRAHVFDTLRALNAEQRTTIIYTTHYMEEAQSLCDRVGIIDHGKLVALDTVPGLLRAHAQPGIAVEVDPEGGATEAAVEALGAFGPIEREGRRLRIAGDGASFAAVARALEERNLRVQRLELVSPNLETVFLRLTGKSLRDVA